VLTMTSCSAQASGDTPELLGKAQTPGVILVTLSVRESVIDEIASMRNRVVRELARPHDAGPCVSPARRTSPDDARVQRQAPADSDRAEPSGRAPGLGEPLRGVSLFPLTLSIRDRVDRVARPGLRRFLGAVALVLGVAGCAAAASPVPELTPELLAKARDVGTVRVLVQFRAPEGAEDIEIQAVKRTVLAELAGTRHRVVRELRGLPVMALEASEDALRALSASPHVLRIEEDRVHRPLR
jgi:hypothetical protein